MIRLSRFVLRHRLAVTLSWLVLFLAGAVAASQLSDQLTRDFSFPSTAADEANGAILATYGNGAGTYPLVPVVVLPDGTGADAPALRQAFDAAAVRPQLRVVSYPSTGDRRFVGADGRTVFGLVFLPPATGGPAPDYGAEITQAMSRVLPAGATVHVTGLGELATADDTGSGSSVLTETLIGALGALVVLAFVFSSLLALVPLLVAAVSILTTFLIVLGLTAFSDVSFIVQFLVALVGLGVAIDYSLLLVTRWREERAHGHPGDEAVHRAMATAGQAVLFSGVTVAIGLVALVVLPVPFLRSVGYGGMLVPLVSVLVTLTLLPVLLATVGRRVDWPRLRREETASRAWRAWAGGVVRFRWLAATVGVLILGALAVSATGLKLGDADSEALARSARPDAAAGLADLTRAGIPTGVLTPIEVLIPAGTAPPTGLDALPGSYAAVVPPDAGWQRGGTRLLVVLPRDEASSDGGKSTITRVRDTLTGVPGARVGGFGVLEKDAQQALYGPFPVLLAVIGLITFILLARAFRSLLLALKAVLLNLLSLAASYGVLVLVWQHGYGSEVVWDIPATGAITFWVPLMCFAFLYGLSMDYEVFILARIREEYDRTGDTRTAIVEGIGRTGRLVTSAGLILFLAFLSLSTAPSTEIKILATGLGAGILLDATVVRCLLVPATVSLFGRGNWWLPNWAARLLFLPVPTSDLPADSPADAPERTPFTTVG
ncbi:MMPL family transporter [Plantactinospora sp. S1510]|uniref:MMPL family transporter n=1 Tax=Plantactinospora alkalitolerans TaxID=2789879 RepID=A0ABS0GWH5_9ACTN|nr:MMPL family transporter [Plantactinospora alkalitolerans]MBF9130242.1 MMPL family transporter [Plantactinospora alkalitolerans]